MLSVELDPFIEAAVAEVLEAMCFVSSEGLAQGDVAQAQPDWICSEVDFLGNSNGTLGIRVPPDTASNIAANFLGEELVLSAKETCEVICELTNMVCGTLLAQVDSKKIYTLSKPRLTCHDQPAARCERLARTYAIDDGYIQVWLELRATT